MIDRIREILDGVDRKEALKILSEIIGDDYELPVASSLIEKDCDPWLSKPCLVEHQYGEGNEEAGFLGLSSVLKFVEEILNCDDKEYGDVEFQYFVRLESEEEIEENERDKNTTWYTKDESVEIDKLQIQFEMS